MTKEEKIKELKEIYKDDEFLLRSELISLEHNNGWIKIESENDLPKKGSNCHFILKNGFSGIFVDLDDSEYLTLRNRGTHYQPIEKPLKPIY